MSFFTTLPRQLYRASALTEMSPGASTLLHAGRQGDVPDDGVFAEFKRAMLRERVMSGLARARARGRRLGRPGIA
jgi:hypothetical protein